MLEAATPPDLISTKDAAAVRNAALQLTPRDRAALLHDLLDSLEGMPDAELEPTEPVQLSDEWMAEIQRRVEEIKSGKAVLLDGPTVMAELRKKAGL
jgi:putative addiction module component (TIGR02574 family)